MSKDTIRDFKASVDTNIEEISKALKSRNYKFNDVRGVLIAKNEPGKFRPLRIADVKDRVVQKALANLLTDMLSTKYRLDNGCSFAYQENKSIEGAIKKLVEDFKNGNRIILEADIKKFFDNVNRDRLLNKVFADLPDDSINVLLAEALAQNIGNLEDHAHEYQYYFEDSINGIPQGNALSPLLANIYLSKFDQRMISEKLALVRYADDFIVLCKDVAEAEKALEIAKEELEQKLGLELHPLPSPPHKVGSKTRILDPHHHTFSFLSIRFDGKSVWVDEKKLKSLLERMTDICDISKYQKSEFQGLLTILTRLRNLSEGWLASYKFVDVDREFDAIDEFIDYKLLQVFNVLGFKIKTSATVNVKLKATGKVADKFKPELRKNSGVKLCKDFLSTLDRNQIKI